MPSSSTSARPAPLTEHPPRGHPATRALTKTHVNAAVAAATAGKTAKGKAHRHLTEARRTVEVDRVRLEIPVTSVPHEAITRHAPHAAKMTAATAATVATVASLLFPLAPRNRAAGYSKSRPRDLAICGKSPAITSLIHRIFL